MLNLLPLLTFLFLYYLFYTKGQNIIYEWRIAFLVSCTILGLIVYELTEFLSFLNLLTPRAVVSSWTFILFVLIVMCFFTTRRGDWKIYLRWRGLSKIEIFLLFVLIVLIILPTFITAVLAPPNNYDSMCYHMNRVMHWSYNHNVNYYQSHELRCLIFPPWSEYAIMHSWLFNQSDRRCFRGPATHIAEYSISRLI